MKLKITTQITVDDDITGEEIEKIREEFEDVGWENNMIATQPNVHIEEISK
ncbi:hypothetical protein [Konateibacter massiliensis]|uniref:hypothetical protein n=1 Tax=Konateibacter massiliensis TaxID=2002841 RepID=UPI0015D4BC97|nr:hypothetical protein [Konateibacter massiliensis]